MATITNPRWSTYKFGYVPHRPSEAKVHIPSYESVTKSASASPPPAEVDYRPNLLPVRDQGQEGCCVAETMCCIMEYQSRIQIGLHSYTKQSSVHPSIYEPISRCKLWSPSMHSRSPKTKVALLTIHILLVPLALHQRYPKRYMRKLQISKSNRMLRY